MSDGISQKNVTNEKDAVLLSSPIFGTTMRASSVLQKNSKLYGPMNALDVNDCSSSWNSEGNVQSDTTLMIQFGRPVFPTIIKFQFQAGFSVELISLYDVNNTKVAEFALEDIHDLQSFTFNAEKSYRSLKLILEHFSDFYGRVILYKLEIWGMEDLECS